MNDKILVDIPTAAGMLTLGRTKFYELVMRGEIRSVRIGKSVRIAVADVQRFADKLIVEATADSGRRLPTP